MTQARWDVPLGRQYEVLLFVRDYHATHGYAPSMGDVARAMGVTEMAARLKRDRLVDKGFVACSHRVARSTVVTEKGHAYIAGVGGDAALRRETSSRDEAIKASRSDVECEILTTT